jgi:hypothetical protein
LFREAAEADAARSTPLGMAVRALERLASALVIVKPDTVIAWHRQSFRLFWT